MIRLVLDSSMSKAWVIYSNATMMSAWACVLLLMITKYQEIEDRSTCGEVLTLPLQIALIASFIEVLNAAMGVTKANPQIRLLFAVVPLGVELKVAPMLDSCASWQHLFTVGCWSLENTIRFLCFLYESYFPGSLAKKVRFAIGPILFPLGTIAEMLMVIGAANNQDTATMKNVMYGLACLWPLGLYPLMKQLLGQRRKFLAANEVIKKKE